MLPSPCLEKAQIDGLTLEIADDMFGWLTDPRAAIYCATSMLAAVQ